MDLIVTSGTQNPANFVVDFPQSIELNGSYEIAVKSIFTPPSFNFTSKNNSFSILKLGDLSDEDQVGAADFFEGSLSRIPRIVKPFPKDPQLFEILAHFEIPPSHYSNTCEVLAAMQKSLYDNIVENDPLRKNLPKFSIKDGRVKLTFHQKSAGSGNRKKVGDTFFVIHPYSHSEANVLNSLGFCATDERQLYEEIDLEIYSFVTSNSEAFLYSTIASNSLINEQSSRLLCVFPAGSATGLNYHEFLNPTYRPLAVHSFNDIQFEITNVQGEVLELDYLDLMRHHKIATPTIIQLHIRLTI